MDRLTQLGGVAGGSRDSTLDASSSPSEAFVTASEGNSKFSLSEDDSTFDLSPLKDVSLASAAEPDKSLTETDDLIPSKLSPMSKKSDLLDNYGIGKQIDAANILSGGVNIFDDNDNSYDGNELVIDDNAVVLDDKGNLELKESESELSFQKADDTSESILTDNHTIASKDTEVVLQIDGKNVNAIDIGNGLYLYRKEGEEELAAVQIVDDDQQHPSFKFLKVRENAEGNLEVYEEIEIEVPKEVPTKEGKTAEKNTSNVPLKDINKVIKDIKYIVDDNHSTPLDEPTPTMAANLDIIPETGQVSVSETKSDVIKNSVMMMKYNETKKSPLIHSTPNKEGIPLTKVMVNQQLHPNRHSDKVKTIEVNTDGIKQKGDSKNSNSKKESTETAEVLIEVKEKTEERCIDMSGNENVEVEKNKNEKYDTTTSDKRESKTEHNISASNKISSIVEPVIQKDGEANEKTVPEVTDTNNTLKIKNVTETNIFQCSPEGKDTPLEQYEKTNEKSYADNDKIASTGKVSRANDKEKKNNEILNKNIEVIEFSTEKGKLDKTLIILNKDNECDLIVEKKETAVAKSEIKINLEKRETENVQVESKNLTTEVVPLASDLQKCETENPDVNATNKNENVSSIFCNDKNSTTNKLNKDIKFIGNKDLSPLDHDKNTDNLSNDKGQEKLHNIVTDQADQISKIGEEVKPLLDLTAMKNFTQESTLSTVKKDKLVDEYRISADVKEILTHEKDSDLLCNKEKNHAAVVQVSTNTSNIDPNRVQASETVSTSDNHCKETSNYEIPNKTSLFVNPDLASDQTKQIEVEKKQILASESIPATFEFSSLKQKSPCHSQKKSTNLEECMKKQHIPVKPIVDNTLKVKADAVTQKKKEAYNLAKNCPVKVENVPSSSAPISQKMPEIKKDINNQKDSDKKPVKNNSSAVPFGKWTEANRQEFLNKIKESKVPSSSSNANQIKQPNDLNRRDVLQKIDSQRQIGSISGKFDLAAANKLTVKNETKKITMQPMVRPESKVMVKTEALVVNKVSADSGKQPKQEIPPKHFNMPNTTFSVSTSPKTESAMKRPGIYNQDLIDRTIEDIINRAIPGSQQYDNKSNVAKESKKNSKPKDLPCPHNYQSKEPQPQSSPLDVIEMKMNELHGIPFVERPQHELPKVYNKDIKTYAKQEKTKHPAKKVIPNLVPFSSVNQAKFSQEKLTEFDSEEEIIEHEPITGDMELKKINDISKPVAKKTPTTYAIAQTNNNSKKDTFITENDFDKFVRRNSVTYENTLTVNFEDREKPNVVHTLKEKDVMIKPLQTEQNLGNTKHKVSPQHLILHQNKHSDKIQLTSNLIPVHEDVHIKNFPSKLQMAYQSALTAKRHTESPITIIEDKPVKVVYMDMESASYSNQINAQGRDLSPSKKQTTEPKIPTVASCDSGNSDMLETIIDVKYQDKSKSKHQRKQVLTPVDISELELIEPSDLGVEHSPKKKRKMDDVKSDKSSKGIFPKKSYLLGRGGIDDPFQHVAKSSVEELVDQNNAVLNNNATASAIDNLVKAAELLETQSENLISSEISMDSDSQKSTPAKRGRGRPRKYPLPDGSQDKNKTTTPQKKPRLIDSKIPKVDTVSDDDNSNDEGIVQENWTMGKINQNIVCPICNKLFRSENVVFKHVKHCTGPSPNRSESDKRSLCRMSRNSQESDSKSSQDSKSDDVDYEPGKTNSKKETPKKRNSKKISESDVDKQQDVVYDNSLALEKPETGELKQHKSRTITNKSKISDKITNLACDTCGKTFRQLSYLMKHKLQHEKDDPKKKEIISVFTCEICKKEFRKLHHMVQHRLIHNPSRIPSKNSRKSSSEQSVAKEQKVFKQADDQSAAFRCEPCDKSFRKLHHLVEHRETHDGINRQKGSSNASVVIENAPPPTPECDICKKRFRKLHHLIEHKEQHQETSSEKSDDRSVRSALSTKDIIHECSLCYRVFPNEQSLNKHSIICQCKKKQLAAKQNKAVEKSIEDDTSTQIVDDTPETNEIDIEHNTVEEKSDPSAEVLKRPAENNHSQKAEKTEEVEKVTKTPDENKTVVVDNLVSKENDLKILESKPVSVKRDSVKSNKSSLKAADITETPKKKKVEEKNEDAIIAIESTPEKKTHTKDIVALTVTKPTKKKDIVALTVTKPTKTKLRLSAIYKDTQSTVSNDDEEVRYMLNPNFKAHETAEEKFMKVKAMKTSSLPNEPNFKSVRSPLRLSHKILRQKPKLVESRVSSTAKPPEFKPIPSTDSDDRDVKYSFPKTAVHNVRSRVTAHVTKTPKVKRKSLETTQKALSGVSKRKSAGNIISAKFKALAKPAPSDPKIRRRQEADYRCDCGQLFHSAALLARHATLAHTPPRIRRRRSTPAEHIAKPPNPPAPGKSTSIEKPTTTTNSTKSSDTNVDTKAKRSVEMKTEPKTPGRKRKVTGEVVKAPETKTRRTPVQRNVPDSEKKKSLVGKLRKRARLMSTELLPSLASLTSQ